MQLEGMFDLPPRDRSEARWQVNLPLEQRDWNVGLIVGPSGSGKSTIARRLLAEYRDAGRECLDASEFAGNWPADRALIDVFPTALGIKEITDVLSSVGFSSPPAWLRPFAVLSTGERFRMTLARSIAEAETRRQTQVPYASPPQAASSPTTVTARFYSRQPLIFIDEFSSVVDRTVARIGSHAVQKAVRRRGLRLIAASCHYDILDWLQPDWTYEPHAEAFTWRRLQRRPAIELEIARVHPQAWRLFRVHHYLDSGLSKLARCFVGWVGGEPATIVAVLPFPHPARPGWREHRVVCLPDFQGVGLGHATSEYVASLFCATGRPYRSVTSHPAMIAHRARSPVWRMTRPPSRLGLQRLPKWVRTSSTRRLTASFEYAGPVRADDARRFGVVQSASFARHVIDGQ
jgi:hypothetical protein